MEIAASIIAATVLRPSQFGQASLIGFIKLDSDCWFQLDKVFRLKFKSAAGRAVRSRMAAHGQNRPDGHSSDVRLEA